MFVRELLEKTELSGIDKIYLFSKDYSNECIHRKDFSILYKHLLNNKIDDWFLTDKTINILIKG